MAFVARLAERRPSRAAQWALRLAIALPVLAVAALLAQAAGAIDMAGLVLSFTVLAGLCLVTWFLIAAGLRSLWTDGSRGGRRLVLAMVLSLPMLVLFGWIGAQWLAQPATNQLSTDPDDPPLFVDEIAVGAASTPLVAAAPGLAGLRFDLPLDVVVETADRLAAERGWAVSGRRGRVGADDTVLVHYAARTPVLAFPIDLALRAVDEGETTLIDLRGRIDHMPHDLGMIAPLMQGFIEQIDLALVGLGTGQ